MNNNKTLLGLLSLMLLHLGAQSQNAQMADIMRENGKIFVVVGVIVLIFSMLFIYLISIDVKLRKLEKEQKEK